MHTEKIGKVLYGYQRGLILEEGGSRRIFRFDLTSVNGNLATNPQVRNHPELLADAIVKFTADESGAVLSVSTLVFRKSLHDECVSNTNTVVGFSKVRICLCGNATRGIYTQCEACAIKNGQCALCGQEL